METEIILKEEVIIKEEMTTSIKRHHQTEDSAHRPLLQSESDIYPIKYEPDSDWHCDNAKLPIFQVDCKQEPLSDSEIADDTVFPEDIVVKSEFYNYSESMDYNIRDLSLVNQVPPGANVVNQGHSSKYDSDSDCRSDIHNFKIDEGSSVLHEEFNIKSDDSTENNSFIVNVEPAEVYIKNEVDLYDLSSESTNKSYCFEDINILQEDQDSTEAYDYQNSEFILLILFLIFEQRVGIYRGYTLNRRSTRILRNKEK